MNVKEFYAEVSGNYEEVMERLMTEARVYKFLNRFLDTDDFQRMNEGFDKENWEEAFRYSHNLKGVCLNLSLTDLGQKASELCETVRNGAPEVDVTELRKIVAEKYEKVVKAIPKIEVE